MLITRKMLMITHRARLKEEKFVSKHVQNTLNVLNCCKLLYLHKLMGKGIMSKLKMDNNVRII